MFSKTCEYALRAGVILAAHGSALTCQQIASIAHVPPGYLSKVLQAMARTGLVTSRRGPTGGFELARSASTISVLEIVEALGAFERLEEPESREERRMLDPLHAHLNELIEQASRSMATTRLSDLVDDDVRALGRERT